MGCGDRRKEALARVLDGAERNHPAASHGVHNMDPSNLVAGRSLESLQRRRELLETRTELDSVRRKLLRTENALESLAGFLTVLPVPIEIVSEDLSILFANEASKVYHENPGLESASRRETVPRGGDSQESRMLLEALRDNREVVFSVARPGGGVHEVTATPTVLSDGRRAVLCVSNPVVLSGLGNKSVMQAASNPAHSSVDGDAELQKRIAKLAASTLDAVLGQITDGVVVMNHRGEVILVNDAFRNVTGYGSGGPMPLLELLFPDHRKADVLRLSSNKRFETVILTADGGHVPVEMAVSSIPVHMDGPAGILITVRGLEASTVLAQSAAPTRADRSNTGPPIHD